MPTAISVACLPTTPPPMMTTWAGATPGTPPSSLPEPPWADSRAKAPAWIDMRPATCDIGANSGSRPWSSVTVS